MAGELVPLVLIPRYTTLAGGTPDFTTIGMDVTEYESAIVNFWCGDLIASAGSTSLTFEESTDQNTWSNCAMTTGTNPDTSVTANSETQYVATLSKRWFRIKIELPSNAPQDAVQTFWAVGFLQERTT
jgi:hypothetical protein